MALVSNVNHQKFQEMTGGVLSSLKNCAKLKDLHKGSSIHADIVRRGLFDRDVYVGSTLVNMYAKCGALAQAQEVFNELPVRNIVSWNALITGYAQHGHGEEALNCFDCMQRDDLSLSPDAVTYACVLKACGSLKAADKGQELHLQIAKDGSLIKDIFVCTALIDMYAKCGMLAKAQEVFDDIPVRDLVSWNALITGYAQHGHGEKALKCFDRMQLGGFYPNSVTLVCVLKACGSIGASDKGQEIHTKVMRDGSLVKDIVVANALIDMYVKCSLLEKAQEVLDKLPVRNVVSWNALIAGLAQNGLGEKALECYERMQWEGISPDGFSLACMLKACSSIGAVDKGQEFHEYIVRNRYLEKDVVVANALVDMYAKCGALLKAREVFKVLPVRDVVSWNALMTGYAQHGCFEEALNCFERTQQEGLSPDAVTFACILKACGSTKVLEKGQLIHAQIVRDGWLEKDTVVGTALVDMYATWGMLAEAQDVFDKLEVQDVVSWNALIAGYAQHGHGEEAVSCYDQMQLGGLSPAAITYACILKTCGNIGAAEKGQEIHAQIGRDGFLERDIVVTNALVDMYAKCGLLGRAQEVFDSLRGRNVVSWNVLIAGYAQHLHGEMAIVFFAQMLNEGISPDAVTVACILKACGSIEAAGKGQEIHAQIMRGMPLDKDIVVANALVGMYAKCGALVKAQEVFDELQIRNAVTWNTVIAGYAQHGLAEEAWGCFERMQHEGVLPDAVTFADILKACGSIAAADKGQVIHAQIMRDRLQEKDIVIGIALVDMYAKCGLLGKAKEVFDELPDQNVICWNVLLGGYAQCACGEEALKCFERMQHEGLTPDALTFLCILKACGSIVAAYKGQEIHAEIVQDGLFEKDVVVGTALVDMYAKCGMLAEAQEVFDELPCRDIVAWNALISLYAQNVHVVEALKCFRQMQLEGFSPELVTFVCILKACGSIGAAYNGQEIHDKIVKEGSLDKDIIVGYALLDVYANCGMLTEAQATFDKSPVQDVVAWNALLAGYAQFGEDEIVLKLFNKMIGEGIDPDSVTFTLLFYTCSHTGLLDKGEMCYEAMTTAYGIIPTLEHYACIIDIFCRTGHVVRAVALIEEMPFCANLAVWRTMLGACQRWGGTSLGRWAFEHAVQLDEKDSASYICMQNIYAAKGRQEDAGQEWS